MVNLGVSDSDGQAGKSPYEESLLSEPQRSQGKPGETTTRPRTTFRAAWVQDWWLLELASLLIGTVAIIAICVILIQYQDKPAPQMNSVLGVGITLNTIIAILATVGRASLLLPVAECVSQQKWAFFSSSPKPLTELETFDQGSRGAFGSLVLLWRINVRHFASIGALLLIFGLAVDPLSQQLLHYDQQAQADTSSSAYVSTAITWATTSQADNMFNWGRPTDVRDMIQDPPLFMKAAIQNGLFSSGSVLSETLPFCTTGNCTWPLYRSLAVCMRWQDVSDHIKYSKFHNEVKNVTMEKWSLTNRSYIEDSLSNCRLNMSSVAGPKPVINDSRISNALDFSDTIAFSDNPYPLADVFILYKNMLKQNERIFNALEFVLEWCVQEFNTSVVNGTAFTTRQESTNNFTGGGGSLTGPFFNTTSMFGYYSDLGQRKYDVNNGTHYILSNYLRRAFNGSVYFGGGDLYKTSDAAEAFYSQLVPELSIATNQSGITQMLQNIATSMTNVVRQTEHTSRTMDDQNRINTLMRANGTAWREQTFVRVQWSWIAAPMTLVLLSLIFVIFTIVKSHVQKNRYMIWKSSSLPALLALSEDLHQNIGGLRSLSENKSTLKLERASLVRNSDKEWRLQGPRDE